VRAMSGRVAMTPSPLTLRIRADRAHRRADDGLGWAEDAPDPALAGRNAPQAPRRASRRVGMAPSAVQAQAGALAAPRRRPTTDRELTAAVLAAGFSACLGVPYGTSGRFEAPQTKRPKRPTRADRRWALNGAVLAQTE